MYVDPQVVEHVPEEGHDYDKVIEEYFEKNPEETAPQDPLTHVLLIQSEQRQALVHDPWFCATKTRYYRLILHYVYEFIENHMHKYFT